MIILHSMDFDGDDFFQAIKVIESSTTYIIKHNNKIVVHDLIWKGPEDFEAIVAAYRAAFDRGFRLGKECGRESFANDLRNLLNVPQKGEDD